MYSITKRYTARTHPCVLGKPKERACGVATAEGFPEDDDVRLHPVPRTYAPKILMYLLL